MIVALGVVVGWIAGRTVFAFTGGDPRHPAPTSIGATTISAFALVFAILRLLFGPTGYFSTVNGVDPDGDGPLGPLFGGANLTGLALTDPAGLIVGAGHRRRSSASASGRGPRAARTPGSSRSGSAA